MILDGPTARRYIGHVIDGAAAAAGLLGLHADWTTYCHVCGEAGCTVGSEHGAQPDPHPEAEQ